MYPLRNLKRRPVRSALTVMGVALALALSTMMFSIGAGIRHSTEDLLEKGDIDAYVVAEGGDIFIGTAYMEGGRNLSSDIDNYPKVLHSIPALYSTLYLSKNRTPEKAGDVKDVSAMGIDPLLVGNFRGVDLTSPVHAHRIDGGVLPTRQDAFHQDWNVQGRRNINVSLNPNFTAEISINEMVAEEMGLIVGDEVYVGSTIVLQSPVSFTVVNITEAIPEYPWLQSVTLHLSELQFLKALDNDTVNRIFLDLSASADIGSMEKRIEERFPVSFISVEDLFQEIGSVTEAFEGYANMIVAVTFVVAVMFTSTILIISVRERMVELGALRAMGISKRTILKGVMIESLIISILGLIVGLVMGNLMAWLLDGFIKTMGTGLPTGVQFTLFTPMVFLQVTGIGLLVGLTAGMFPVYWVTGLNITVVLKGE